MAGYDRQIVVDAVQAELDRTTDGEDRKFDQALQKFQARRVNLTNARAEARNLCDRIAKCLDDGDYETARKLGDELTGDQWNRNSGVLSKAADPGEVPFRVRSARERSLQRVVDVIGSSDQATVTVADLRSWGVFDFVKHSNDAC